MVGEKHNINQKKKNPEKCVYVGSFTQAQDLAIKLHT